MIDTSAGPYNEPPLQPVAPTMLWSEAEYTQLVNATLRQVHSVLALARSPLADSPLVTPLLVLDDVSPTADERGQALRLLLQWAVDQLAPARPTHPLGAYRPPDDPTWPIRAGGATTSYAIATWSRSTPTSLWKVGVSPKRCWR